MSRSLERHWQRARGYLKQRQLTAARAELESLCALAPGDVRTRLLAAQIAWHEDHVRDAATCALDAAQAAPDDPDVLCDVIQTLLLVGERVAAHALLARQVWNEAGAAETLLHYADFRQHFGEHAESLSAIDRLLAKHPEDAAFHCYRGQQLEYLGRLGEAEAEFEACLAREPRFGHAAYHLVRLPRPDLGHGLELVGAGLARARPGSRERIDFGFAHYHVLEGLGRTGAAWVALATANALVHSNVAAQAAQQREGLRRVQEWGAAHAVRSTATQAAGPCPIFIIGLPRSGTTVLERMLGNHSMVASAGELVDFGQQLLREADTRCDYSDAFFERLRTLDFAELGQRYLAQTAWRARGKAYFVDKQPSNWITAGLIHVALPQAKILHLVRDPMDACFSAWRARFADAYAWSYDLADVAAHYAAYRDLMQLWHAMYPGAILDVPYADLVRAPAATLHKVFDFCGLAWEAGCEDLTRNTTPVSSLSSAQVREPVHARTLGQWRRYANQMEPLCRALA